MFKGNIASQVGSLYKPEDLRRADAFQIFYLGINAGVIAAPLIVGTLGEKVGWHWGFGAAGVGMLIGLAIYLAGQQYLPRRAFRAAAQGRARRAPQASNATTGRRVIALLAADPGARRRDRPQQPDLQRLSHLGRPAVRPRLHGARKLPTTWLVTLDAIVSVSFLAGVALFYRWYGKRWREPDEITKIIIGSRFSIAGMLCLFMAAATQGDGREDRPVLARRVPHPEQHRLRAHAAGQPRAVRQGSRPQAINATVIGLYYLAFFAANSLVGWIGGFLRDACRRRASGCSTPASRQAAARCSCCSSC